MSQALRYSSFLISHSGRGDAALLPFEIPLELPSKLCKIFHGSEDIPNVYLRKSMSSNTLPRGGGGRGIAEVDLPSAGSKAAMSRLRDLGANLAMAYKEFFWMTCDSTEQLRAEYGPFHTRSEAEIEARKLGFGYLLRYEHILGESEQVEEVRCIFVELPGATPVGDEAVPVTLHTRCATCGESAAHDKSWEAEVWADIHEFEHSRHLVRLFEHARGKGLKEIGDWRS